MPRYMCRSCGQYHEGPPLSYGAYAPAMWYIVPEEERERRTLLSSDLCIIDNEHFLIVGNIDIPILGSNDIFTWSVWVSLSQHNFQRVVKLWNEPGRESESPYFGWLTTALPAYPNTLGLKTHVHTRSVGQRPFVEVELTDHPLALEQQKGITWERVQAIAEIVLHGA